ncbi:MAG: helix-hairpin-helix domain-containing protein [Cytophagales bacterium]|nr:helix-hairpin-helix domain-containing protein [Bernardetiaceae bacterium]MDW8211116.1 helix-hairpin-helix domain-containing protein [Cytophagales bacterium]
MKRYLAALCLLASYSTLSQPSRTLADVDVDQFIQAIFAQQDQDINYEDAYESLYLLYANPLDLNRATYEQLADLYILSPYQINHLLEHRKKYGDLLSIYELQAVEGFDLETIYKILPFVTVRETTFAADARSLWQKILQEENRYLIYRHSRILEKQQGYLPLTPSDTLPNGAPQTRYLGLPDKVYARLRVSHLRDFSLGLTVEKDAGEPIIWNPTKRQYGMDFWSAHVAIYNRHRLKTLVIGDYLIQAGQGMLLAAGFTLGKGAETITTIRRSNTGIKPYTSVVENGFFRGVAATINWGKFDITPFVSLARRSGNVQFSELDTLSEMDVLAQAFANSIIPTGFHRTERELATKNTIRETTAGITATYRSANRSLEAGITALSTRFSTFLQPIDRIYNRFEFKGNYNGTVGGFFSYNFRNVNIFGEAAGSTSGGVGLLTGWIGSLSTHIDIAMLLRHYDKHFHTFYGQSFSENTRPINESGIYWGIKIKPTHRWTLAAYYDLFRFPWLRFLADAPSSGSEYLARLTYQPSKKVAMYGQFRQETKGRNLRDNVTAMDLVVPSTRQNFQLNVDLKVEKIITTRSRIQWSSYQQQGGSKTQGFAIIQDWTIDLSWFKYSGRFALFDTDDYENRQFVFEKDVLYAFSIPSYYGLGMRSYHMLQFNIGRKTDLWIRYALTELKNQNSIGSGLDQIIGNRRSEVKVQIRQFF